MSLLANLAVAVGILLAGVSALLAVVGLLSYRRVGHARLLWVALAFMAFAGQGVYFARYAYLRRGDLAGGWDAVANLSLVNLIIVLFLYLAVLKR